MLPSISALDPNRFIKFESTLRSKRVASVLGIALGISFFTCFFTGLVSHFMQHPQAWMHWNPRPAGFYRATQGLHVASGLISIPLLLSKLWNIFPKLFEFPPVTSAAQALERISIFPLIGGSLLQLVTGVANINQWYFFKFFFTSAHYAVAWVVIGALIVHIGAKVTVVRAALAHNSPDAGSDEERVSWRRFLYGVFGTAGVVTTFTVGEAFSPLGKLALLGPRRPGIGPQGLPVNKSAQSAGVMETAMSPDYRLTVTGRDVANPLSLELSDLQAMAQNATTLPIACVEGWSADGHWRGVRVRDLLAVAGAPKRASVRVVSLEKNGLYGQSILNPKYVADSDTLLALELNGAPLDIQHGFPCRLIAPNRPGVLQTKWVTQVVVI